MFRVSALTLLSVLSLSRAQFAGFGFAPMQAFENSRFQTFDNRMDQAAGSAAGAGQASALQGTAQSINQANHQASRGRTSSNALSANMAAGIGPQAGGAAQAGGQTSLSRNRGSIFENNAGAMIGFRRKRQVGWGGFGPMSNARANSLGGGSAMFGNVNTRNMAYSNANPWGAQGLASGSANGMGQGVNIWNAAMSNSAYGGRRKRQIFPGMFDGNMFGSNSNANSLGGASTLFGSGLANNLAYTNSDGFGASGMGSGNAFADGYSPSAWNAASSNSLYG